MNRLASIKADNISLCGRCERLFQEIIIRMAAAALNDFPPFAAYVYIERIKATKRNYLTKGSGIFVSPE